MITLVGQNIIRIAAVALCLSTLSFAAGVAGDLSIIDPPRSGQRVILRIPPEIPIDAPRARALLSTVSAEAAPVRFAERQPSGGELRRLVAVVQFAHEEGFGAAPTVVDSGEAPPLKPLVQAEVKSEPEASTGPSEIKAA